jgi:hypothetical protein
MSRVPGLDQEPCECVRLTSRALVTNFIAPSYAPAMPGEASSSPMRCARCERPRRIASSSSPNVDAIGIDAERHYAG